jgi:hypothetical protein
MRSSNKSIHPSLSFVIGTSGEFLWMHCVSVVIVLIDRVGEAHHMLLERSLAWHDLHAGRWPTPHHQQTKSVILW